MGSTEISLDLPGDLDPGDAELFYQSLLRSLDFDNMLRYITMGSPASSIDDLKITEQSILPLALGYYMLGAEVGGGDTLLSNPMIPINQRYGVDPFIFGPGSNPPPSDAPPPHSSSDILLQIPNNHNASAPSAPRIPLIEAYPGNRPNPNSTRVPRDG